jgi:hypothetical protein
MKIKNILFVLIAGAVFATPVVIATSNDDVKEISLGTENIVVNPPQSTTIVPETTTTVAETTTTTTTTLPDLSGIDWVEFARGVYGKCGEWHDLALSVGWTENEWPTLSKVIWKESRCQFDAWNGWDAGLTQINQIHTEWLNELGYTHPDDMFDPKNNLWFAYKLYSSREERGRCGWKPWSISC